MAPILRPPVPEEWIRTEADREAIRLGYWFDEEAARFACDFFELVLKVTIGKLKGRPFVLEPWQRDFVCRLYGWMRDDGTRRFRESYLEVPKKNGKSTLFAGLCLLSLMEEPTAEVYQGAVDSSQSAIIYREICRMIAASPDLKRLMKPRNKRFISFAQNDAFLESLTAEIDAKDGANASAVFLDEVHLYPPAAKIYTIFKGSGAAREQPILGSLTTAGGEKRGLCWELNQRARRILQGSTDDLEFLGVIYSAVKDDGSDPTDAELDDPAAWYKANPSLGTILKERDFAVEWAAAKENPRLKADFLRRRFGIWTDPDVLWINMVLWDHATGPAQDRWWRDGRPVHAALDLSSVSDLTSLTLCNLDGDTLAWRSRYYMPEETAGIRSRRDAVPYQAWIDAGYMRPTEGNATDYEAIRRDLIDLRDSGVNIVSVGMDPWNAAHLASLLIQDGFNVVMIRQGFGSLSAPCKELERRLANGTVLHDGNPVTRWCASNVVLEKDAMENIKPSKRKSAERIDGVASGVMALGLATSKIIPIPGVSIL